MISIYKIAWVIYIFNEKRMAKFLIIAGIILVAIGLILYFAPWLINWFGKLPGDVRIENKNSRIYFPWVSMIVISIVLTILVNLFRWLKKSNLFGVWPESKFSSPSFLKLTYFEVKVFNLFAGPWGFTQKCQTRFDAGIVIKTSDFDFVTQVFPSVKIDKFVKDHLKGFAMQRIIGLPFHHKINPSRS
jgi:hypothetical protein